MLETILPRRGVSHALREIFALNGRLTYRPACSIWSVHRALSSVEVWALWWCWA